MTASREVRKALRAARLQAIRAELDEAEDSFPRGGRAALDRIASATRALRTWRADDEGCVG